MYEYHAGIYLSQHSTQRLKQTLTRIGINESSFILHPHITIYYAETEVRLQPAFNQICDIHIEAEFLRFMVMVPGGENFSDTIIPKNHKIGLRIQRQANAMQDIYALRKEWMDQERQKMNLDQYSGYRRSAFGAPHYQPHLTILSAQNGISDILRPYGDALREQVGALHFDRYILIERQTARLDA